MTPAKKQAIISALIYGTMMSIYFSFHHTILVAIAMGAGSGLFLGVLVYLFSKSKRYNKTLTIEIPGEENAIYVGVANHLKNGEWVGGKMALFNNELYFKSHGYNIQNHELQIPLGSINQVQPYNMAGVLRNGLEIKTNDGGNEKFVVYNRGHWQSAILAAKAVGV